MTAKMCNILCLSSNSAMKFVSLFTMRESRQYPMFFLILFLEHGEISFGLSLPLTILADPLAVHLLTSGVCVCV